MQRCASGWFLTEFGIAFAAGVIGAMVAAHRHASPPSGAHPGSPAPGQQQAPAPCRPAEVRT